MRNQPASKPGQLQNTMQPRPPQLPDKVDRTPGPQMRVSDVLRFCFPQDDVRARNEKNEFQKRHAKENKKPGHFYEFNLADDSPFGRLDCLALFGPLSPDGYLCQSLCLPGSGLQSVRKTRACEERKRAKAVAERRRIEDIRKELRRALGITSEDASGLMALGKITALGGAGAAEDAGGFHDASSGGAQEAHLDLDPTTPADDRPSARPDLPGGTSAQVQVSFAEPAPTEQASMTPADDAFAATDLLFPAKRRFRPPRTGLAKDIEIARPERKEQEATGTKAGKAKGSSSAPGGQKSAATTGAASPSVDIFGFDEKAKTSAGSSNFSKTRLRRPAEHWEARLLEIKNADEMIGSSEDPYVKGVRQELLNAIEMELMDEQGGHDDGGGAPATRAGRGHEDDDSSSSDEEVDRVVVNMASSPRKGAVESPAPGDSNSVDKDHDNHGSLEDGSTSSPSPTKKAVHHQSKANARAEKARRLLLQELNLRREEDIRPGRRLKYDVGIVKNNKALADAEASVWEGALNRVRNRDEIEQKWIQSIVDELEELSPAGAGLGGSAQIDASISNGKKTEAGTTVPGDANTEEMDVQKRRAVAIQQRRLTNQEIYTMYREVHLHKWRKVFPQYTGCFDDLLSLTLGLVDTVKLGAEKLQQRPSAVPKPYLANLGQAPDALTAGKNTAHCVPPYGRDSWRASWRNEGVYGAMLEHERNQWSQVPDVKERSAKRKDHFEQRLKKKLSAVDGIKPSGEKYKNAEKIRNMRKEIQQEVFSPGLATLPRDAFLQRGGGELSVDLTASSPLNRAGDGTKSTYVMVPKGVVAGGGKNVDSSDHLVQPIRRLDLPKHSPRGIINNGKNVPAVASNKNNSKTHRKTNTSSTSNRVSNCVYTVEDVLYFLQNCIVSDWQTGASPRNHYNVDKVKAINVDVPDLSVSSSSPPGPTTTTQLLTTDQVIDFKRFQAKVVENLKNRFEKAKFLVQKVRDPSLLAQDFTEARKNAEFVKEKTMPPIPVTPSIAQQVEAYVRENGAFMVHPLPGKMKPSPRGRSKSPQPRSPRHKREPALKLPHLSGNGGTGTHNWWAL
ncbi:unnamed protein product [Amoebophrya sp. A120]|nr:unnamed protein product [Amoebophrya sp. A120]|eukprot:GSA120T00020014001.1